VSEIKVIPGHINNSISVVFRKQFATTNETILRQQLGELKDHGIIQEDPKNSGILLTVKREILVTFLEGKQGLEEE